MEGEIPLLKYDPALKGRATDMRRMNPAYSRYRIGNP
jgi:hypothetical protein